MRCSLLGSNTYLPALSHRLAQVLRLVHAGAALPASLLVICVCTLTHFYADHVNMSAPLGVLSGGEPLFTGFWGVHTAITAAGKV